MRKLPAGLAIAGAGCGMPGRPAPALVEYEVDNPTSCDARVTHYAGGVISTLAFVPRRARVVLHVPDNGRVSVGALTPEGKECDGGARQPSMRRLDPRRAHGG